MASYILCIAWLIFQFSPHPLNLVKMIFTALNFVEFWVHSTISHSKVLRSKSAYDPYLIHIMLKFLLINRVGSAIIGSMLNKPSTDVICMKWRHHYDVIIVTSSCDVTCHKHGRFLHQNFDFDSVFLSSEWKYAFETSHICYSKGFAFVHWVATIINVIMMSYKQLKVKNVKNMGDCGKYLLINLLQYLNNL